MDLVLLKPQDTSSYISPMLCSIRPGCTISQTELNVRGATQVVQVDLN